jgi:hypothetical protein
MTPTELDIAIPADSPVVGFRRTVKARHRESRDLCPFSSLPSMISAFGGQDLQKRGGRVDR